MGGSGSRLQEKAVALKVVGSRFFPAPLLETRAQAPTGTGEVPKEPLASAQSALEEPGMARHTMTMEDYNQVARFGLCAFAMSCQPGQLFHGTAEALQEVVFSLDKHVFLWLVPCPIPRRPCQGSCVCALIWPQ
ncbi:hypothetical protein PO909_006096 [Leuciscus waleckii]